MTNKSEQITLLEQSLARHKRLIDRYQNERNLLARMFEILADKCKLSDDERAAIRAEAIKK